MSAAPNLPIEYGGPLTPEDYALHDRSWITPEILNSAVVFRVNNEDGKGIVGRRDHEDYTGTVFSYIWPGEKRAHMHRLRRDNPPYSIKGGLRVSRDKYLSAPGAGNRLYFHPLTPAASLLDASLPIMITEGEKKTLALYRLSYEGVSEAATAPLFLCIGLPGAWAFRDSRQKTADATGKRVSLSAPIADLDRVMMAGRKIYIVFDTNVITNPKVAAARIELARELASRGAEVWFVDLPVEEGINGIDDFLAEHGPEPALKLIQSARLFDPKEQLAKFHYTDHGNEKAFETVAGNDYLYNWTERCWFHWNGTIWERDLCGAVDRAMVEVAHARLQATSLITTQTPGFELVGGGVEDRKKRAMAGAIKLQNMTGRRAALESAQTNPHFARRAEDFDQDDYLFGCGNGVLDLRTLMFRPGRREDMITKSTPVYWIPTAGYGEWLEFLCGVFPDRPDMVAFIQCAVGYSLLGLTREEVFFILHGSGRNGKGTFLRVLLAVLGEYAANTEFTTLITENGRSKGPRNDIAAIAGKRLVTAQESRQGAQLDESLIKALTGGDLITARFLHKEFFTFRPTWKIWLATNHKPDIKGTDCGIWSRPKLIPFTVSFAGKEDRGLKDRLLDPYSLSGILRWAAEGAREYLEHGLTYPDEVLRATSDYRAETDVVGSFISECCVVGQGSVASRALYAAFQRWSTSNMSEKEFSGQIKERFDAVRRNSGVRIMGLALIADSEENNGGAV